MIEIVKKCVASLNFVFAALWLKQKYEQGRIHGKPVADGWAGAVMPKNVTNLRTYRPTRQGEESRVRD